MLVQRCVSFLYRPWDSRCLFAPDCILPDLQCCIVIRIGIVKCTIYCKYLYLNTKMMSHKYPPRCYCLCINTFLYRVFQKKMQPTFIRVSSGNDRI